MTQDEQQTQQARKAGDAVLANLIDVTGPPVKGAHDAEMVLANGKAYIVAELNDVQPGEAASWDFIYCAMSIVDLATMRLERVEPFARTEQAYANTTLPAGCCFVPRIIQKDVNTLRCYFASEKPGQRQSQTWYRDFDLTSEKFADTIHRCR